MNPKSKEFPAGSALSVDVDALGLYFPEGHEVNCGGSHAIGQLLL